MAVSKRLRAEIFRRDNHTCQSCGAKAPDVVIVPDHVVPVALGGSDHPSNLRTLCEPCNSGKSATPPDAAVVAKVAEDALRWSQAIQAAADDMLGGVKGRDAARATFDAKWKAWSEGRPPVPRPADWGVSIDNFLKAGLPMPILLDCVDIAMRARTVKANEVFTYMCGAAWKEVKKLQNAAREILTPGSAPAVQHVPTVEEFEHEQILADLLDLLTPEERKLHEIDPVAALSFDLDEDEQYPIVSAIDAALSDLRSDLWSLSWAADKILRAMPGGVGEYGMKIARYEMYDRLGTENITRHRFSEWAIRYAVRLIRTNEASAYLDRLPSPKRSAWMEYAETLQNTANANFPWSDLTSDERLTNAAHHARMAEQGHTHHAMCVGPGDVIENCPKPATFRVLVEQLDCCAVDISDGHGHGMCDGHLELLMGGEYRVPDGELRTVRDFKEIEPAEADDPPF